MCPYRFGGAAFVGVTGASGSGKSTLMNLLGGLDTPSSGSIRVAGKSISELSKRDLARYRRRNGGDDLPVVQSRDVTFGPGERDTCRCSLPMSPRSSVWNERAQAVEGGRSWRSGATHRPTELSGGEQQRVAIARALVNQPENPSGRRADGKPRQQDVTASSVQILSDLRETQGLTIVMISHEEDLLREFADEIVYLQDGSVIGRETAGGGS